jgi:hypothetical protein
MGTKQKPKVGWGELNVALNALVKERLILNYSAAAGMSGAMTVEVTVTSGADQAEVVRRVREALPSAFSEAQVRTRTA